MDFSQIKFRASSWGNLLTEPVSKAAKEAGELSVTCQKELVKIYNQELYGRKKDITTRQMDKGIAVEKAAIKLVAKLEGKQFYKNTELYDNEWFKGHPDILAINDEFITEECSDIKCSWELDTFMPKLIESVDKSYEAQLNVYYDLTGTNGGNLYYCLLSAPKHLINMEKEFLFNRMAKNQDGILTEQSPNYLEAVAEMENLMDYEDIDYRERVIKIPVPRNDELIQKMKDKVPILRNWLDDFHKKHMNQYPK
jgi:hypothetical protein